MLSFYSEIFSLMVSIYCNVLQIVKQEPNSPQNFLQMPPSPDEGHDIWELLCDTDVKPSLKVSLFKASHVYILQRD